MGGMAWFQPARVLSRTASVLTVCGSLDPRVG